MKGERRHELQHNALADYIAGVVSSVKPYSNALLGGVLLVAVAAAGYLWWSGKSVKNEEAGCDEFLALKNKPDFRLYDLDGFKKRHEGTKVSFRVLTFAGNMGLIQGCRMLFTNKATAHEELGKAEKNYTEVLNECDDPELLMRATFGLARVHEALGRLEQAVERYEEVVQNKKWSGTACASQAKKRLEFLAQADNEWFYDRFAEYDPTPKTEPIDPRIPRFDIDSLPEPSGSGGGSSLLDLPSLDSKTGPPGDPSLLPALGGMGKTEPTDPGDDDGTETDPTAPPSEPPPSEPSATEPAIPDAAEPSATEPAIPDATEPADSGTDAAPPASR